MQLQPARSNKPKKKSLRSRMKASERYNSIMLRKKFNKPMEETQA